MAEKTRVAGYHVKGYDVPAHYRAKPKKGKKGK